MLVELEAALHRGRPQNAFSSSPEPLSVSRFSPSPENTSRIRTVHSSCAAWFSCSSPVLAADNETKSVVSMNDAFCPRVRDDRCLRELCCELRRVVLQQEGVLRREWSRHRGRHRRGILAPSGSEYVFLALGNG